MSNEELLQPRYKVIADYPSNCIEVGEIIELKIGDDERFSTDGIKHPYAYTPNGAEAEYSLDRYPHLFQRLKWWQERQESDMPKYVKYIRLDNEQLRIVKVATWDVRNGVEVAFRTTEGDWCLCNEQDSPATEAEYEAYKSLINS